MVRFYALILVCLLPCLNATDFRQALIEKEVPVLYEGRFRPASTVPPEAPLLVLPTRKNPALWVPLDAVAYTQTNFTPYPNQDFQRIRQAYLKGNERTVAKQLKKSYKKLLAGTPYLEGSHQSLYFPTKTRLVVEAFYIHFPWIHLATALYALALLTLLFFRSPWLGPLMLFLAFATHTTILGLRVYILERPPVSNMLETILYVPWIIIILGTMGWLYQRSRSILQAVAAIATTFFVFSEFLDLHHHLDNVQAVLNSQYWLITHVLLVVASYGAFILAGVFAHYALYKPLPDGWILSPLYTGTILLLMGTILGGVWAAESWGRFWDWDPKESWAFISICLYLILIHLHRYKKIDSRGLALGAIIGLQVITFTWYGVNYILGVGLHSYGFGHGGEWLYALFVALDALIVFLLFNRRLFKINYL